MSTGIDICTAAFASFRTTIRQLKTRRVPIVQVPVSRSTAKAGNNTERGGSEEYMYLEKAKQQASKP
jgi:hypothetical protein